MVDKQMKHHKPIFQNCEKRVVHCRHFQFLCPFRYSQPLFVNCSCQRCQCHSKQSNSGLRLLTRRPERTWVQRDKKSDPFQVLILKFLFSSCKIVSEQVRVHIEHYRQSNDSKSVAEYTELIVSLANDTKPTLSMLNVT